MMVLRILAQAGPVDYRRESTDARIRGAAFILGLVAIILEFPVSDNTLELRGIVRRGLCIGFAGTITASAMIRVSSTNIGEPISTHIYLDESADVRRLQWQVLNHLNLRDVLFGVPDGIEKFWLLMFLSPGAIGFVVLLIASASLVVHLGRTTAHPPGLMLLFAAILTDSPSNSLGRKSADLFSATACMIAMPGLPAAAPAMSLRCRTLTNPRRFTDRPSNANLAGFRS